MPADPATMTEDYPVPDPARHTLTVEFVAKDIGDSTVADLLAAARTVADCARETAGIAGFGLSLASTSANGVAFPVAQGDA